MTRSHVYAFAFIRVLRTVRGLNWNENKKKQKTKKVLKKLTKHATYVCANVFLDFLLSSIFFFFFCSVNVSVRHVIHIVFFDLCLVLVRFPMVSSASALYICSCVVALLCLYVYATCIKK